MLCEAPGIWIRLAPEQLNLSEPETRRQLSPGRSSSGAIVSYLGAHSGGDSRDNHWPSGRKGAGGAAYRREHWWRSHWRQRSERWNGPCPAVFGPWCPDTSSGSGHPVAQVLSQIDGTIAAVGRALLADSLGTKESGTGDVLAGGQPEEAGRYRCPECERGPARGSRCIGWDEWEPVGTSRQVAEPRWGRRRSGSERSR